MTNESFHFSLKQISRLVWIRCFPSNIKVVRALKRNDNEVPEPTSDVQCATCLLTSSGCRCSRSSQWFSILVHLNLRFMDVPEASCIYLIMNVRTSEIPSWLSPHSLVSQMYSELKVWTLAPEVAGSGSNDS